MARYVGPVITGPEPLSPMAIFAVNGGHVYAGESLTPEIRVWETGGTLEREISWQPAESASTSETLRLVVDSAVARAQPDRAAVTATSGSRTCAAATVGILEGDRR